MDDPFFMVWNPETGRTHMKHPTHSQARKEADRLANANPGKRFYVLAATGFAQVTNSRWTQIAVTPQPAKCAPAQWRDARPMPDWMDAPY